MKKICAFILAFLSNGGFGSQFYKEHNVYEGKRWTAFEQAKNMFLTAKTVKDLSFKDKTYEFMDMLIAYSVTEESNGAGDDVHKADNDFANILTKLKHDKNLFETFWHDFDKIEENLIISEKVCWITDWHRCDMERMRVFLQESVGKMKQLVFEYLICQKSPHVLEKIHDQVWADIGSGLLLKERRFRLSEYLFYRFITNDFLGEL